ncbi:hypothetical protein DL770_006815 [Monosporascus sp. CRB-9-2]|nr:hypothetical protein DL770_006815 [Monosporascus sp. CRB-9-2]
MDHHRLPRRSASHGTLRGTYAYHGSPGTGPSYVRPFHKPLRSVNEDSVLLPSPGALESMLKTTTETGDIGTFSIKPVTSPKRRGTFTDIGQHQQPPRRSVDEAYRHYSRGRFPSLRDITPEILSMSTSDSQRSLGSTLSPTLTEDFGPRSFSTTTCGSRYTSHYSSTATLQSQASGGHLQRPRSPFPYPTRLKRPGIRPASPALTETGHVDYSRMVEIDRISLRTVHGAYKRIRPPGPRMPHPLGLRAEIYQSTPPLLGHGPRLIRKSSRGPPFIRPQPAASVASWDAPYHGKLDSASTRTSSLTSVVNMYHRIPPPLREGPDGISAPPPRYYDYTEDFESVASQAPAPLQPLAPFPTRAMSNRQLMVPSRESQSRLALNSGQRDSAFFDDNSQQADSGDAEDTIGILLDSDVEVEPDAGASGPEQQRLRNRASSTRSQNNVVDLDCSGTPRGSFKESDIDLLPSQLGRDSMEAFNPSLDIGSRKLSIYNSTHYRPNATPKTNRKFPERQVQVQDSEASSIRSEQGVILRGDCQEMLLDEIESESRPEEHSEVARELATGLQSPDGGRSISEPVPYSAKEWDRRRYGRRFDTANIIRSNGPIHSSSPKQTDAHTHGDKATTSLLPDQATKSDIISPEKLRINHGKEVLTPDSATKAHEIEDHKQQFRCHERNNDAALEIGTSDLPGNANKGFPHITLTCSTTTIVSPKPISPARQLRLKNSIPQLMKALPPLPGDLGYTAPPTPPATGDEDEFAEILSPFDFPRSFSFDRIQKPGAVKTNPRLHAGHAPSSAKDIPKLRLKMRLAENPTPVRSENSPWNSDTNSTGSGAGAQFDLEHARLLRGRPSQAPRKLKLRSPRNSTVNATTSATIRRDPASQGSDIIAEIASQQPRDLFSLKHGVNLAIRQQKSKKAGQEEKKLVLAYETLAARASL